VKKSNTKIVILVVSIFALLAVHIFIKGEDIAYAIGGMILEIAIGLVVGGLVLFNVLLFIYNIFKPENKLKFDIWDKFIAGIWVMIIFKFFSIF